MIEYVNRNLVPVWVNVREQSYPKVFATQHEDWVLMTSADGTVMHPYYHQYLVRTYVLSPDLWTLLNEEDGLLGRAQMHSNPYLDMLRRSVERWRMKRAQSVARSA